MPIALQEQSAVLGQPSIHPVRPLRCEVPPLPPMCGKPEHGSFILTTYLPGMLNALGDWGRYLAGEEMQVMMNPSLVNTAGINPK